MKKGISLIVLVITIIVMIILAAAVIISMNNTGVIDKASQAVKLTDEKQVQDLAALTWAEAYLDKNRTDTIENVVKDKLEEQGITDTDWNIEVSNTGVIVTKKENSDSNEDTDNMLSGMWKLNETLIQSGWATGDVAKQQAINYTIYYDNGTTSNKTLIVYYVHRMESPSSDGVIVSYCRGISSDVGHVYSLYHFTKGTDCDGFAEQPVILDFGSIPQEVNPEFYAWFTANAVKQ